MTFNNLLYSGRLLGCIELQLWSSRWPYSSLRIIAGPIRCRKRTIRRNYRLKHPPRSAVTWKVRKSSKTFWNPYVIITPFTDDRGKTSGLLSLLLSNRFGFTNSVLVGTPQVREANKCLDADATWSASCGSLGRPFGRQAGSSSGCYFRPGQRPPIDNTLRFGQTPMKQKHSTATCIPWSVDFGISFQFFCCIALKLFW